jgi:hypothetical protein
MTESSQEQSGVAETVDFASVRQATHFAPRSVEHVVGTVEDTQSHVPLQSAYGRARRDHLLLIRRRRHTLGQSVHAWEGWFVFYSATDSTLRPVVSND